jgi:hypothetical protein
MHCVLLSFGCRLWVITEDDALWRISLKDPQAQHGVEAVATAGIGPMVIGPSLSGQLCGYGYLGEDIVCAQLGPDGTILSSNPLPIKWPELCMRVAGMCSWCAAVMCVVLPFHLVVL